MFKALGFLTFACLVAVGVAAVDAGQVVADRSVEGYKLAVQGGDKIEICARAGIVVAAFNQANDRDNYLKWKEIERQDCKMLHLGSFREPSDTGAACTVPNVGVGTCEEVSSCLGRVYSGFCPGADSVRCCI
jgi:hypothetical protein